MFGRPAWADNRAGAPLPDQHPPKADDDIVERLNGDLLGQLIHEVLNLVVTDFRQRHLSEMRDQTPTDD
jgi:hypothetical protein